MDGGSKRLIPESLDAQVKSCPKGAYLGLCEKGLVVGVPAGAYSAGEDNKGYAVDAIRLLLRDPTLTAAGPGVLWTRVMNGREKTPNGQMSVVLALWSSGLISRSHNP